MEASERFALRLPRVAELRMDPAGFSTWLLAALLVVYLALNNGGYSEIQRSEVGVAIWWLILIGTAVGLLPAAGGTRTGRLMLGALVIFAAWTGLSLTWSESAGRSA